MKGFLEFQCFFKKTFILGYEIYVNHYSNYDMEIYDLKLKSIF